MSVTLPPAQNVRGPDGVIAATGKVLLVRTTVSMERAHPLLIVHEKLAVLPALTVTIDVGELTDVMVPAPLISDQVPAPEHGVVAAIVNAALPQ